MVGTSQGEQPTNGTFSVERVLAAMLTQRESPSRQPFLGTLEQALAVQSLARLGGCALAEALAAAACRLASGHPSHPHPQHQLWRGLPRGPDKDGARQ